jgi:ATP-dependent Clp protease ATP-binding subunit ClpB
LRPFLLTQDAFVSTEGLVLALCKEDDKFTRPALEKQGVTFEDVLDAIKSIRETSGAATSRSAENLYDALDKYGIDFTQRAREGKLDPVIGRDDEIRRAIQILSRRTKNNPVLIGDPGVGKSLHVQTFPTCLCVCDECAMYSLCSCHGQQVKLPLRKALPSV